ncbi:MAG: hypothetical protein ABH841_03075 [Candidatus Nealsonbacteria bacterium]
MNKFILITFLLIGLIIIQPISAVLASDEGGSDYGGDGGSDYGGDGGSDYGGDGGSDYSDDGGSDSGSDVTTPTSTPAPTPTPTPVPTPTPTPTPTPVPTAILTYNPGSGGGGGYIYPPTVDIKANSSDGPISIPYGTSAYLYWSSSNALSCWASNDWSSGLKSNFGSEPTGILTSSKTYTIFCLGQNGSASDSVTVNVGPIISPDISIIKSVRNINQNTPYQDMVYAFPGDSLSFKIEVETIGNQEVVNVSVKDILPEEIIYEGNLRIDDQTVSGDISNISLGIFIKKQIKTITFDAKVSPKNKFSYGLTTLTNQSALKADNVAEIFDAATVNVNNLSGEVGLTITKKVKNLTKGDVEWKNEITSEPGNILQFQLNVANTTTATINGIQIKDILHSKLIYSGNLLIDGIASNQDIAMGLSFGDIAGNQIKTIVFNVKVAAENNFNYGATELINIANISSDDFSLFATAKIIVTRKVVLGATDIVTGVDASYFDNSSPSAVAQATVTKTGINIFYIALIITLFLTIPVYFFLVKRCSDF